MTRARRAITTLTFAAAFGIAVEPSGYRVHAAAFPDPVRDIAPSGSREQTAVLAGGCFWGMEAMFERLKGVSEVVSGFAGGSPATAHYALVSTGTTGHAESVRITHDSSVITFGRLLKVFFAVAHDPTQLNRQGPDDGTQYRSSIFYAGEDQKEVAVAYIRQLDAAGAFRRPIVTTVVPLQGFYQRLVEQFPDLVTRR
jgi:peptide-methionine (S)-S-oxide reductase